MARLSFRARWLGSLACAAAFGAAAQTPSLAPSPSWLVSAEHAPRQPRSGEPVKITAHVRPGVTNVTLQCQLVEPGAYLELKDPAYTSNWIECKMQPSASTTNGMLWVADLPAELQKHRRLVRYRLNASDRAGGRLGAPLTTNQPANFAYFVYDGVPAWTGAINPRSGDPRLSATLTFPPETMNRVQAYHLIAKKTSIENVTWRERTGGKEYKYTGTLVVGDQVFDHVGFRARGGIWRYALGKNMWKFDLARGDGLRARDDFGRPYPVPWSKINLRACIQQGDYGYRGEQGMFESVGFRLFNLAGVPAPHTHWVQLRIVDEAKETPADQYRGDFWGLYLAIENEDGRFLQTHGLPDGNLYKMADGTGELRHHGAGAVTNRSDLDQFMAATYRGNLPDAWWRANVNLAGYYSYRAICECIHHYDIGDGKNYDYHYNPVTKQWQVIPWDIDLTWADTMYGSGEDPFRRRVLSRPAFRIEYQNRLREIRDLLFNPEQTGQMIDEFAAVIWDPNGAPSLVEADRRKWDYHPAMAMGGKAGQGLFYEAARTRDFRGMLQLMKNYVKSRGAWIDAALLNDPQIPATPSVSATGPPGFPARRLRFRASAYQGPQGFAAIGWRMAEITPANPGTAAPRQPRLYEILSVWENEETITPPGGIQIPEGVAKAGHTYRVRVRMKDVTGRWSHWSAPVEFVAGKDLP